MILLVFLLVSNGAFAYSGNLTSTNKTVKLVEKIRRQLMEDNYDYLPSEDDLITPVHAADGADGADGADAPRDLLSADDERYVSDDAAADRAADSNKLDDEYRSRVQGRPRHVRGDDDNKDDEEDEAERRFVPKDNEDFVPRAKATANQFHEVAERRDSAKGHVVSKKDLLYYVDDERLRGRSSGEDFDERDAPPPTPAPAAPPAPASTAKYKVIKVKSVHPSRRSASFRRFIQEESAAGVALISLDDAPFPEFHLPRARRQYMQDRDSAELSDGPLAPRESRTPVANLASPNTNR